MGISDFGEMDRLSKIAQPDISVITNIGLCHLENLKTRDGILKAKTEIFNNMKPDGIAILNGSAICAEVSSNAAPTQAAASALYII